MKAHSFEDAAAEALGAMLQRCGVALAAGPFAKTGKILRGMVHLRPGDGYRRLVIVDAGASAPATVVGSDERAAAFLPSATAWRWVAEHRCALAIDVNTGRVQTHVDGKLTVIQEHGDSGKFAGHESTQRLLSRDASHLYVIPLRTGAGAVDGMISIEARCRAAIGGEFIWPDCGHELQLLAGVASPYLTSLPLRPDAAPTPDDLLPVIGATMAGLVRMLRVFAAQEETILIGGPTGAGKTMLARWCHAQSSRREQPFEHLDLMTVPEDLQMAEIFGWKRGAFSGAVKDTPGAISRAEGGTLFIDEIDKLSLRAQAGLLQLLDSRAYRPLGDGASQRIADVRFIVGTNADLAASVRAGRFREDLYYRISVLPIRVPSLDERRDEIALWAGYMLSRQHRRLTPTGRARLSGEAERVLTAVRWPGNLRELDNIVKRAYAMAHVERAMGSDDVLLGEQHVRSALEYDARGEPALTALLRDAADAFVQEAERRAQRGEVFGLKHAEAFSGFVLGTAARRFGKERAYRLLGKERLLANRNHHKDLKEELKQVEALYAALGEGASPFADLIEGDTK